MIFIYKNYKQKKNCTALMAVQLMEKTMKRSKVVILIELDCG